MRRSRTIGGAAAAIAAVGLLAGCTGPAAPQPPAAAPPAAASSTAPAATRVAAQQLRVPEGLAQAPFDRARTVYAPAGWTVSLWARVGGARMAVWTPDEKLLVSRPDSGDVQVLTPGGDPAAAPAAAPLIEGLRQPHGMAFDGDTLYIASSDRVDSWQYAGGRLSDRRTVVEGLPDASTPELRGAYAHALKSVAIGRDHTVYVSVGSTGNVSPEDRTADPQRASILKVVDGKAVPFASGVRNGTGLAVAPDGAVWTAVNNRDRTAYPYDRAYSGSGGSDLGTVLQEYVNDHPLEPVAKLTQGRDLGWPYCNPDPDVSPGVADTAFDYSDRPFVRDAEMNRDGSELDCAALASVEQGLPAHSAPLGMSFTGAGVLPQGAGALIGVHGSWNRTPPRAPEVVFMSYRSGGLGDAQTLLSGFQLSDGSRWGRPVAAVAGPDGAVYVTDDDAGAVYRMTPPA